jgi:REP element-mobilizing transposase RayT
MPRPPRIDSPLARHHLINGGVGDRPIHETEQDIRVLLARVEKVVGDGLIRIHAAAILATHYHFLVESPEGRISEAVQRYQDSYARYYNRTRNRRGPLYKHRFWSKEITTGTQWVTTLRYIDRNAIKAGLVTEPTDYPWGSAWHYARDTRPGWLTRTDVEDFVRRASGDTRYRPERYVGLWGDGGGDPDYEERLVLQRVREDLPLDDLVRGSDGEVLDWMRERAAAADGVPPGLVIVSPGGILGALGPDALASAPPPLLVGLLRNACGLTYEEISRRVALSSSTVRRLDRLHNERLLEEQRYAERAARALRIALDRDLPTTVIDHTPFGRGR